MMDRYRVFMSEAWSNYYILDDTYHSLSPAPPISNDTDDSISIDYLDETIDDSLILN